MQADRRRVAVVARRLTGLSGVTILIREHAARAARTGWETDVIGERVDRSVFQAVGATPIELSPGWFTKRSAGWFAGAAARATATGYTLVHGHGDSLDQDVLSLHNCIHATHEAVHGASLTADAPTAESARGHSRQLGDHRFRRLITNSRLMRDDVMSRFGVPAESIRVVYPGFDPAQFHPRTRTAAAMQVRRHVGVGDDTIVAGLVTSGDWTKRGVTTFIEALRLVCRDSPVSVVGLVTGKERSMDRYRRLAARLGVSNHLHFLPVRESLAPVYGALDVFVYPAQFEEFGMCVQEAMACGLPIVCGRRIGATELLDPAGQRLLLDTVSAATVAESLAAFVSDRDLRQRAGAINAASVARNTWDRSAAGVIAAYRELVSA